MSELKKIENFVIFTTKSAKVNIEVYFADDTLWLTQKIIAKLFEKGRTTVTEHLRNIFIEGELEENSVCRDFRHTAQDGKISALKAKLKAEQEFEEYRIKQDAEYISDFDREIKRITGNKNDY